MNEVELCTVLGLTSDPVENRVQVDPLIELEILTLKYIFNVVQAQKQVYGPVNPDIWCEFVPWHSLN